MKRDLFGEKIKNKLSLLEKDLRKYDNETFDDRIERIKWLEKILPNCDYLMEFDTALIFEEAKTSFINGQFIATIILANAFIEHYLQGKLINKGFIGEAKQGLKDIVKFIRKNGMLHEYLCKKINHLRQFRNPFIHLKEWEHPHRISQKMFIEKSPPFYIIEKEAKEAIRLMYKISITDLN